MVCGSHAKTRALYSTPPCPSLATSTAAYRRRSFSDSQPKNRFIFCSISAEYPSMPHSLIRGLLCRKETAAQAIREVILDHILIMDAAAVRRAQKEDREWGIDEQDIFHRVVLFLPTITIRLFSRALRADDTPFRAVM